MVSVMILQPIVIPLSTSFYAPSDLFSCLSLPIFFMYMSFLQDAVLWKIEKYKNTIFHWLSYLFFTLEMPIHGC